MRWMSGMVVVALGTGCGVDGGALFGSVQKSLAPSSNQQALIAVGAANVQCENGGSADVGVNVDIDTNSPLFDLTVLFGYDIEYDACQPDENTIDGELHYAASIITDATDSGGLVVIRTTYEGTITVSGETNGSCEIDVEAEVSAGSYGLPGDEFRAGVDVDYSGTICDQDASAVVRVDVDS